MSVLVCKMNNRIFERPITALVTYNEVLRDQNVFLLHVILDNPKIRKQFSEYFDLERFSSQSEERIRAMLFGRNIKNILEWGAIKEFDYELNYNKMYHQFIRMFEDSPPLDMYKAISQMVEEPFLKKIFIWNYEEDRRQMYDIKQTFDTNRKVEYVTGPYLDVVDAIGEINLIVDNDIDRISPVIYDKRFSSAVFSVAKYGYNYEIKDNLYVLKDNIVDYTAKNRITLTEFSPFKLSKESFANG